MTEEKKPATELNEAKILEKVSKGEELTPEETEFAAGAPDVKEPAPLDEGEEKDESEKDEEEAGAEAASTPKADEEEEPAKEPAAKKSEEAKTAKERRALIDAELSKPDEEVNLAPFTPTEIGLYWDLKKARRKTQKVEQENRELKFKDLKRAVAEGLKEAEKPEEEAEDEDPLKGRDEDDILTVADVRKILGKKPKAEKKPDEDGGTKPLMTREAVKKQRGEAAAILKGKGIEDFEDVIDFAAYALEGDEEAREELIETAKAGGNVTEKTYWLIKGSQVWPKIEAEIKKGKKPAGGKVSEDNLGRAERIQKNEQKVRTTGAPGGGGGAPGEYTEAEILEMSPRDFGRLPAKTQEAILRKYGAEPNLNV